jgi:deoxyribonuclease-4
MKRTNRIGRHLPVAGGLGGTLKKAMELGCETVQVFVSNPQGWAIPEGPREDGEMFAQGARDAGIGPVVVHAKYLINLAAEDEQKRTRSIEALAGEMRVSAEIGADLAVVHSGSHGGDGVGIERLAEGLTRARELAGEVEVVLENSVGGGNQLCADLDSLAEAAELAGVRVCIDTAHAFAAGYDLSKPEKTAQTALLMRESLGDRVALFHLNDARNPLGGKKDGHARIGEGRIPPPSFRELFAVFPEVPVAMETPYGTSEVDSEQIKWVKELAGGLQEGVW